MADTPKSPKLAEMQQQIDARMGRTIGQNDHGALARVYAAALNTYGAKSEGMTLAARAVRDFAQLLREEY